MDRETAAKGGRTTVERHGVEHMQAIGRIGGPRGFAATVARHWGGDKEAYLAHQRRRANQAVLDALIEADHHTKLAAGAEMACTELPIIVDPDDDQTFRDMVSQSWRGPASRAG